MFTAKPASILNQANEEITPLTCLDSLYIEKAYYDGTNDISIVRLNLTKHLPINYNVNSISNTINYKSSTISNPYDETKYTVNSNNNSSILLSISAINSDITTNSNETMKSGYIKNYLDLTSLLFNYTTPSGWDSRASVIDASFDGIDTRINTINSSCTYLNNFTNDLSTFYRSNTWINISWANLQTKISNSTLLINNIYVIPYERDSQYFDVYDETEEEEEFPNSSIGLLAISENSFSDEAIYIKDGKIQPYIIRFDYRSYDPTGTSGGIYYMKDPSNNNEAPFDFLNRYQLENNGTNSWKKVFESNNINNIIKSDSLYMYITGNSNNIYIGYNNEKIYLGGSATKNQIKIGNNNSSIKLFYSPNNVVIGNNNSNISNLGDFKYISIKNNNSSISISGNNIQIGNNNSSILLQNVSIYNIGNNCNNINMKGNNTVSLYSGCKFTKSIGDAPNNITFTKGSWSTIDDPNSLYFNGSIYAKYFYKKS